MFIVIILTVLILNPFVYNLSIQEASAIKHITSPSNEDGALPSSTSSSPSPQSKTTTTADCINYDTFYNNQLINSPYTLNSHNKITGIRPIITR